MRNYEVVQSAIAEKARAERIYMHYALALAVVLAVAGLALVILGIGDHMDIVIQGRGDWGARFINASPGVVLWLLGAGVFYLSKPRQLQAEASHHSPRPVLERLNTNPVAQAAPSERDPRSPYVAEFDESPVTRKPIRISRSVFGTIALGDGETHIELPEGTHEADISRDMAIAILAKRKTDLAEGKSAVLIKSLGQRGRTAMIVTVRKGATGYVVSDGVTSADVPNHVQARQLTTERAVALLEMKEAADARASGKLPEFVIRVVGNSPVTGNPIAICRGRIGDYHPYVTDGESFAEYGSARPEAITLAMAIGLLAKSRVNQSTKLERPEQGNVAVLYQTPIEQRPSLTATGAAIGDDVEAQSEST